MKEMFFSAKNPLEKAYFIFKLTGNRPASQFWQIESALRLYLGKKKMPEIKCWQAKRDS